MNIEDLLNSPKPGGSPSPEMEARFKEITEGIVFCSNQTELRQLLVLNNRQEILSAMGSRIGISCTLLELGGTPSMIMAIRRKKENPIRLLGLAATRGTKHEALSFFLAIVKTCNDELGAGKVEARTLSDPNLN